MTIDTILAERGKAHGPFTLHAAITQDLKSVMARQASWQRLTASQREALEMIAHKLGRILAGDPNHLDHWDDIAGYAVLVTRELRSCRHE
jgi:hypothetical protein